GASRLLSVLSVGGRADFARIRFSELLLSVSSVRGVPVSERNSSNHFIFLLQMRGVGTDKTDRSQPRVDGIFDRSRSTAGVDWLLYAQPAEVYEIFTGSLNNVFIVKKTPLSAVHVACCKAVPQFAGLDSFR